MGSIKHLAAVILICLFTAYQVGAICENTADTYHCENTRRISCSQWRDGNYTDCGGTDYSDEIYTKACTPPYASSTGGTFNCENVAGGSTNVPCSQFRDGTTQCTGPGADEYCYNKAENYTCRDGSKISCYLFQDGKNDCGDNSDEGVLYTCPEKTIGGTKKPNFKCTRRNELDDFSTAICQAWSFAQDGTAECTDKSDEAILINGRNCSGRSSGLKCIDLIPGSTCVSEKCACDAGKMATNSKSRCLQRVPDDPCTSSTDCTAALTGMDCDQTGKCYCTVGYYVYNPNGNEIRSGDTICKNRKLYENCTTMAECSNVISFGECTNNICLCNTDYIPEPTTNASCKSRVLDDPCDTTAQCNVGMQNAVCNGSSVCVCHVGAYNNSGRTNCIQRVIGESCTFDAMCSLSPNTTCTVEGNKQTCQCKTQDAGVPWIVSYNKGQCAYGLGDLFCLTDENCTAHFDNSTCYQNTTCLCADTYYESGYRTCTRFAIGSSNCGPNDCSHIANAECDSFSTCQCRHTYELQSGVCMYVGQKTDCGFACQYPWALALLIIGILAIIVVIVILCIKKPWKKPEDEKKQPARSVAPYSNGGPTYDSDNGKPIWTLRPKSGNPVMYDHMHLQEPNDPEVDAFFSGGKKKKKAQLPPIEDEEKNIFVFKGQHERTPRGRKSLDKTNVRDDGYHTCGFETEDGSSCQFSTDSYYRMRMHKKETSHFIRKSWPAKKSKKRKPSLTKRRKSEKDRTPVSLGNIEEEVGQVYTDEEEDDPALLALNDAGIRTSSYEDQQYQQQQQYSQSPSSGIGRHIALAFASMEEPMQVEDTTNLLSDDENDINAGQTRVVNVTPHDLNDRPFTPEPTGVMSPGDISVTNFNAEHSPVTQLETSGISEVAKANSHTEQPPGEEDDDGSSSDDDDEDNAGGDGKDDGKKGGKKGKKGKGKKGKGGKGSKKEKGGKKGKKDGDGKKAKKGDKKGGKDKKEKASGKKGKDRQIKRHRLDTADDSFIDSVARANSIYTRPGMTEIETTRLDNSGPPPTPPVTHMISEDRTKSGLRRENKVHSEISTPEQKDLSDRLITPSTTGIRFEIINEEPGGLTSVESPDRTLLFDVEDRKVHFDESVPPTPMTPGNIDVDMDAVNGALMSEEDVDRLVITDEIRGQIDDDVPQGDEVPIVTALQSASFEDGDDEGEETKAKGKKGKKGKKDKGGKKKKGKKGNKNNNAILTPDDCGPDDEYYSNQFAIESETSPGNSRLTDLQKKANESSISKQEINNLVEEANNGRDVIMKVQTINRERSLLNLQEKLTLRRQQKRDQMSNCDDDDNDNDLATIVTT